MPLIVPILAKIAVGAVADKIGSVAMSGCAGQASLEKAVAARIDNDPKLKNDLNAEPLWQSRTATGSMLAFCASLAIVMGKVQARQFDPEFGIALATVIGSGYAFAGRALNWSAPMWSRVGRWFS